MALAQKTFLERRDKMAWPSRDGSDPSFYLLI